MKERQDELVRVDTTGAAHPVGRRASRELRARQGPFRLMPSPPHVIVMRAVEQNGHAEGGFWMSGEITRPGALWDLIGMFAQGNWSGVLAVQNDDGERAVFFDRGTVLGAGSTAERERLGAILYQYGVLTAEQVQIVAEAVTPNVRFGEAAVALGFLANDQLFEIIGKQTEEIVYATMMVSQGTFYFREGVDESRLPYRLNLSVSALLMEGVRRMDEMECFRARIPSGLHVPVHAPGARLDPAHEHYPVFAAIDGARSIDDVGRAIGAGPFDTTRALFQLLQAGVIQVHSPRPTGTQAIVQLFNQAMATILGEVDRCGGGKHVREQLASFATASGVYDALFRDAGPAPDGTLAAAKVADTVQTLAGEHSAESMLRQWLFEYASFAMFIAEPILRSSKQSDASAVSRQVVELLKTIAPEG